MLFALPSFKTFPVQVGYRISYLNTGIGQILGNTDRYFKAPTGKASFNLQKMARDALRFKLSTALHTERDLAWFSD